MAYFHLLGKSKAGPLICIALREGGASGAPAAPLPCTPSSINRLAQARAFPSSPSLVPGGPGAGAFQANLLSACRQDPPPSPTWTQSPDRNVRVQSRVAHATAPQESRAEGHPGPICLLIWGCPRLWGPCSVEVRKCPLRGIEVPAWVGWCTQVSIHLPGWVVSQEADRGHLGDEACGLAGDG